MPSQICTIEATSETRVNRFHSRSLMSNSLHVLFAMLLNIHCCLSVGDSGGGCVNGGGGGGGDGRLGIGGSVRGGGWEN